MFGKITNNKVSVASGGLFKNGTPRGQIRFASRNMVSTDPNSGKYEIVDSTASTGAEKASAVLAHDTDLTGADVVVTVYISGQFNREKLIVAQTADNATAHEEELRAVNIYLTSVK